MVKAGYGMAEIDTHWRQLRGRWDGTELSDPRDCAVFALETGAGLVAFDAGAGLGPAGPVAAAHLFLTHAHADHAGGAAACPGRLHAGELTALWLERADEDAVSLPAARRAGVYPPEYRLVPRRVDAVLADGAITRIGEAEIHAVATPGHSADHVSFLVHAYGRRTLVAGDALFADGTIILQDTWDSSVAQSCASIRRLAALGFDMLLPGHGPILREGGPEAVRIAMARIDRLLPPRNFL